MFKVLLYLLLKYLRNFLNFPVLDLQLRAIAKQPSMKQMVIIDVFFNTHFFLQALIVFIFVWPNLDILTLLTLCFVYVLLIPVPRIALIRKINLSN